VRVTVMRDCGDFVGCSAAPILKLVPVWVSPLGYRLVHNLFQIGVRRGLRGAREKSVNRHSHPGRRISSDFTFTNPLAGHGVCCSHAAAPMVVTPLLTYRGPSLRQTPLLLKDETQQISGSFKYRSAYARLRKARSNSSFVAASTGNHGLALATAARVFGHNARIFISYNTPAEKLRLIRAQDALCILIAGDLKDCSKAAIDDASSTGSTYISSFDDPESIDGHRSMMEEIETEAGDFDNVFVPVAGGGMLAAALLHWPDRTRCVFGVEQVSVLAMYKSLQSARRVVVATDDSIAEGINVPQVGKIAFALCSKYRPCLLAVSEQEIREAMRLLWRWNGIRAEGAGAAAFAGALKHTGTFKNDVCVVSGGNISDERFVSICGADVLPYAL
jgi:threonine dehydratase